MHSRVHGEKSDDQSANYALGSCTHSCGKVKGQFKFRFLDGDCIAAILSSLEVVSSCALLKYIFKHSNNVF